MLIRYAIMGLLENREMHGYAVKAAFEARLGPVWSINFGQIYQVLKDLRRRGLVEGRYDNGARHLGRWTYKLTARGRRSLETWLRRSPRPPQPTRHELFIRLLALEGKPSGPVLEHLARDESVCREHLNRLLADRQENSGNDSRATLRALAAEAAIAQATAHLEWLGLCARVLSKRDREHEEESD